MKIDLPNKVRRTLQTIHRSGYEAYVVGGCVRDALIGIQIHDYDITTNAKPSIIMEIFKGNTIIETGLKHGTVTVIIEDMPIEITTYRIDGPYGDNRHPQKVSFAQELKDDLQRRDFTMNAIAFNEDHGIIDFFYGKKDIENKVIRCVGNPDERFEEDALRIIRALRFSSTLGFRIDKKATQSIHTNKELLKNISIERITSEFSKMICGKYIERKLMEFSDVITVIIPELLPIIEFHQPNVPHNYLRAVKAIVDTPTILHMRLASLLHNTKPNSMLGDSSEIQCKQEQSAKAVKKILQDMRYDKDTIQKVYTLVRYYDLEIWVDEKYIKRWMNKLTPQVLIEVLELRKVRERYHTDDIQKLVEIDQMTESIDRILFYGDCYLIKDLAINGDEILKLGVTPGRQVGNILADLLDAVIEGRVSNNKAELQRLVQDYLMK